MARKSSINVEQFSKIISIYTYYLLWNEFTTNSKRRLFAILMFAKWTQNCDDDDKQLR